MVTDLTSSKLLLPEKIAIVTGGSRGIGQAIVHELLRRGNGVVFTYQKSYEEAESMVEKLNNFGLPLMAVQADVSKAEDVDRVAEITLSRFKRIDILVNNAGITLNQLLVRTSREDMLAVLQTNVIGTMLMTKAVSRHMTRQRSGVILNMSSIVGTMGNSGQSVYAASKAAINGFTMSMAQELASRGIRVNSLAPGVFFTDIWAGVSQEHKDAVIQQIPLKRAGTLEELAKTAAFLVSDDSSYITGKVIEADGGLHMG